MGLPNFLVIGAAKAGTTSLYRYLQEHPDVFVTEEKEPKFFAYEGGRPTFGGPRDEETNSQVVTDIDAYRALFANAGSRRAVGEASTTYLWSDRAPAAIRRHLGTPRLVVVLRNPVERAFSAWLHLRRQGREPIPVFRDALAAESRRSGWDLLWQYEAAGRYHAQVKRYVDLFGRDALLVLVYKDLAANPTATIEKVYRFLGVDASFRPDVSRKHNATRVPRLRGFHEFLTRPSRLRALAGAVVPRSLHKRIVERVVEINLVRPTMLPEDREYLAGRYREDVSALGELLGTDFSFWLDPDPR